MLVPLLSYGGDVDDGHIDDGISMLMGVMEGEGDASHKTGTAGRAGQAGPAGKTGNTGT